MKASELRTKDVAALEKEVSDLLKAHFGLRMQRATQQLANNSQLGKTRRDIARVKTVLTEATSTLNISSTAALISGFVASRRTLKITWFCFSPRRVAFSEMIGATSTVARRPSANLRCSGVGLMRLMRTSP